jgi:acyl carrier protein
VSVSREQVAEAVRGIIRTDLKFDGMELPDNLALVGDGLGLDSLDLLMIVTGIEKRFQHKIPQRKLNRDTMSTVGRFIDFAHAELVAAGK